MTISIIAAVAENNVIGKNNKLIWHLPADLKYFKNITLGHSIIMGRKTFESVGKPLPGRKNVIITRQKQYSATDCYVVGSLNEAIELTKSENEVFIVGGAEVYNLSLPFVHKMYLTKIHQKFDGDTFFPEFDTQYWKEISRVDCKADIKNIYDYSFCVYEKMV